MVVAVLLLVVVGAVAAAVVVRARRRRAGERRLARGLDDLTLRLDALADGLGRAVDRARADSLRARTVESLERVVEFDEALARCAEAAAALPSVDLAVARVDVDGLPRVATAGSDAPLAETATRRTGVAVPLEVEGSRLGTLTVYGRSGEPPVPADELDALQAISRRSARALTAARYPVVAPPRTHAGHGELGDRELFHETLALLAARARRQGSTLTVCVLDIDDFKLVNGRIGPAAGDRVIAELADVLRELIRPTDLAFRTGGDEFAVALPDSGRIEAESLYARLQASLARRPDASEVRIGVSAGIAELEPDDDGVSLFQRATASLQRAKAAGKGTAA